MYRLMKHDLKRSVLILGKREVLHLNLFEDSLTLGSRSKRGWSSIFCNIILTNSIVGLLQHIKDVEKLRNVFTFVASYENILDSCQFWRGRPCTERPNVILARTILLNT